MLRNSTKRLTEELVSTFLPQAKPVVIRDAQLSRFGLRISRKHLTWIVQADRPARYGPRRTFVVRIAKYPLVSLPDARARAIKILAAVEQGLDPTLLPEHSGNSITLAQAWASFEGALASKVAEGTRSDKTLDHYRDMFSRLLIPLHGSTLASLSAQPAVAKRLHERIAEENGKPTADSAMRMLRATYRHSARNDRSLSAEHHCCTSIEFSSKTPSPDRSALAPADMSEWYRQLRKLGNEVRQEMNLFTLLSGLRINDVLTARLEHIDWAKRTLWVEKPKGRRSFFLPLSRAMARCLWRARAAGRKIYPRHAAVFCFAGKSGGLGYNAYDLPVTGHGSRRSFRTIALTCGVPQEIVERLMNHRGKGNSQSADYIVDRAAMATYAAAQERISAAIICALCPDPAHRRGLS